MVDLHLQRSVFTTIGQRIKSKIRGSELLTVPAAGSFEVQR